MRKVDADEVQYIADCELTTEQAGIVRYILAHTPTLSEDAEPVRHAHWELKHVPPGYFTPGGNRPWACSNCKTIVSWMLDRPRERYCSWCGAKMEDEKNG